MPEKTKPMASDEKQSLEVKKKDATAKRRKNQAVTDAPELTPSPASGNQNASLPEQKQRKRRVTAKAIQQDTENLQVKMNSNQVDAQKTNENEGVETRKEIEGKRLIKLIRKTLIDRDLPERTIADIMGVTTIYWNSMANGNRKIKSLGKDKLGKVAEFLGLPTIQVYILADYFDASDFFNKKTLDDQQWLAMTKMAEDPQWAGYAPTREQWEALPVNVRAGYATLYEREYNRTLMAKAEVEVPGFTTSDSAQ